jgi:uncharacterized protein with PIN domain
MPSPDMLNNEDIKFAVDDMLGKLAKWLRILGFNVSYYRTIPDKDIITAANSENRVLLTRDTKLAASGEAQRCILIESGDYREQLRQVFKLLPLKAEKHKFFSRCLICNEVLISVAKDDVKGKVPPFIFKTQNEFVSCLKCAKIYWKGTHNNRIEEFLEKILNQDLA